LNSYRNKIELVDVIPNDRPRARFSIPPTQLHHQAFRFCAIGNMGSVGIIFERVVWKRRF
jgi:hypothetical protein